MMRRGFRLLEALAPYILANHEVWLKDADGNMTRVIITK